jgi:hypothetical protein
MIELLQTWAVTMSGFGVVLWVCHAGAAGIERLGR